MKYSRQRQAILEAVQRTNIHPTADDVYTMVRTEYPNISLATVYRNLNLLSELGEIRKIPMPGGSDRFDGRLMPHYHMCCQECGNVFDIYLEQIGQLDRYIQDTTGFHVGSLELMVRGVCPHCRQEKTA